MLNTKLAFDLEIPVLYISSTEIERVHTRTCTQMFITTLFITAKMWEQLWCLSADERISSMSHTLTTECYVAIKTRDMTIYVTISTNLGNITWSERIQLQTLHMVWFHLYYMPRIETFMGPESRPWFPRDGRDEGLGNGS